MTMEVNIPDVVAAVSELGEHPYTMSDGEAEKL